MRGGARPPAHLGVCLGGGALLDLAAIWPDAVGGAALVVPLGLHPGKQRVRPLCLPAGWVWVSLGGVTCVLIRTLMFVGCTSVCASLPQPAACLGACMYSCALHLLPSSWQLPTVFITPLLQVL